MFSILHELNKIFFRKQHYDVWFVAIMEAEAELIIIIIIITVIVIIVITIQRLAETGVILKGKRV